MGKQGDMGTSKVAGGPAREQVGQQGSRWASKGVGRQPISNFKMQQFDQTFLMVQANVATFKVAIALASAH